jgi:hypothetical protein
MYDLRDIFDLVKLINKYFKIKFKLDVVCINKVLCINLIFFKNEKKKNITH